MTAQASEQLVNDNAHVDLDGLRLYRVVVGDIPNDRRSRKSYAVASHPKGELGPANSALWRGYISRYRLTSEGRLQLEGFEYPTLSGHSHEDAFETLQGDFWLEMAKSFFGPSTYIPFRNGMVVCDSSEWLRGE